MDDYLNEFNSNNNMNSLSSAALPALGGESNSFSFPTDEKTFYLGFEKIVEVIREPMTPKNYVVLDYHSAGKSKTKSSLDVAVAEESKTKSSVDADAAGKSKSKSSEDIASAGRSNNTKSSSDASDSSKKARVFPRRACPGCGRCGGCGCEKPPHLCMNDMDWCRRMLKDDY